MPNLVSKCCVKSGGSDDASTNFYGSCKKCRTGAFIEGSEQSLAHRLANLVAGRWQFGVGDSNRTACIDANRAKQKAFSADTPTPQQ